MIPQGSLSLDEGAIPPKGTFEYNVVHSTYIAIGCRATCCELCGVQCMQKWKKKGEKPI